jgi:hypothetical protein
MFAILNDRIKYCKVLYAFIQNPGLFYEKQKNKISSLQNNQCQHETIANTTSQLIKHDISLNCITKTLQVHRIVTINSEEFIMTKAQIPYSTPISNKLVKKWSASTYIDRHEQQLSFKAVLEFPFLPQWISRFKVSYVPKSFQPLCSIGKHLIVCCICSSTKVVVKWKNDFIYQLIEAH